MGSLSYTIRIAMLNADTPVPNVYAKTKTYGTIFHNLLSDAASRISPHTTVESTDFDVVRGVYPVSPLDFDAILVTGSAASAYYDEPWIHTLQAYLTTIYHTYPQVKIFGSCFGHQIVCQSLLGACSRVEKNPAGWELGVHGIRLTDDFRKAFPSAGKTQTLECPNLQLTPAPEMMRLQFVHADHVAIFEELPKSWKMVGETKRCGVQGVFEPGRVLTFQGHFEFDRFVNSETIKVFGALWDPVVFQKAMNAIDADDDALAAAEIVLRFML
ncbi:class I glutamine amidotransferase-like protein [Dactylonectria macrodidyma]|uniref:Class I glutamine amidotransferase-like protein n=1 Tax=Dactylonectria macrodidyma TaxID=307937 RepID=A0A9P9J6H1_9HYPO|nr:class I glutamine amidotransferase-like protein [Dactylonectria macrodidyma]